MEVVSTTLDRVVVVAEGNDFTERCAVVIDVCKGRRDDSEEYPRGVGQLLLQEETGCPLVGTQMTLDLAKWRDGIIMADVVVAAIIMMITTRKISLVR
jgi:hypothetical protein